MASIGSPDLANAQGTAFLVKGMGPLLALAGRGNMLSKKKVADSPDPQSVKRRSHAALLRS